MDTPTHSAEGKDEQANNRDEDGENSQIILTRQRHKGDAMESGAAEHVEVGVFAQHKDCDGCGCDNKTVGPPATHCGSQSNEDVVAV